MIVIKRMQKQCMLMCMCACRVCRCAYARVCVHENVYEHICIHAMHVWLCVRVHHLALSELPVYLSQRQRPLHQRLRTSRPSSRGDCHSCWWKGEARVKKWLLFVSVSLLCRSSSPNSPNTLFLELCDKDV